jgi:pyruvate, water dikinase
VVKVSKNILWFSDVNKDSIPLVGGKGANLGEMYNLKLPVPPGFIVSASAFKRFIEETGIGKEIFSKLKDLDVESTDKLQAIAKEVQTIIIKTPMPKDIQHDLFEAYETMTTEQEPPFVAVRSSATAEDLPTASFAGQQATYLNIQGQRKLQAAVTACWASLYTARAIYYRIKNKFPHEKVFIAVVIQKMVNADAAGIMFSANPVTNNLDEVLIEASYGLGEAVVSGSITPDEYLIDKKTIKIKDKKIVKKTWMTTKDPHTNETTKATIQMDKQSEPCLTDEQAQELAKLAIKVEDHYGKPQDLEFAIEKGKLYITQSRPITTLKNKPKKQDNNELPEPEEEIGLEIKDANLLVSGIPASPGIGKGKVILVHDISDLSKIKKGDVLVARMTNPDYVVAMERASAIITDTGGSTAHAAIVSREMGIPCVVGTEVATSKLKNGDFVTVDGAKGKVYEGNVGIAIEEKHERLDIKTDIEVKVIMDLPDYAERAAATGADGVGLLRGEFINLNKREHPVHMIKTGRKEEFVDNLISNLKKVCKAFKGKPIWYRTLDAPTDEFRNLPGGENEPHEDNPMMGWRSIRRSLDQPELLKAEYEAVKTVHEHGCKNLGIMLPLVTHVEQVREAKKIFEQHTGLTPVKEIEFGIMIETPASVQIIEDLCKEGLSFISIGTNDLTQFTLACDRSSSKVQKLYDEMHPAVLKQIHKVIKTCKKYHIKTSICGQAGSRKEMAEFLFKEGIDSISANPDAVYNIRKTIARLEGKLKNRNNK